MGPLARPWPWFVAGPLIGLFVPVLLLVGNRLFGISGSLRAACAALVPGRVEYFQYDWRRLGYNDRRWTRQVPEVQGS